MEEESIDVSDRIRKLASVQTVSKILPHPDADRLELATILGWQVVIAKGGEVGQGQKVVYCEIDSKLPGAASWLPAAVQRRVANQKKGDWFRVKTACIRGQLSQGLIVVMDDDLLEEKEIGHDMTAVLGIEKYKEPVFLGSNVQIATGSGNCWKPFPHDLLPKTEEPRIQSNPWMLQSLVAKQYYATVKLDGTSGTYLVDPKTDEFWVCSRNHVRSKLVTATGDDDNDSSAVVCPYWEAAKNCNLQAKLRVDATNNKHLAIQGEVCGPRIAKNPLGLDRIQLFVFNIYDLRTRRKLPFPELVETCAKLGLNMVPLERVGDSFGSSGETETTASTTIGSLLEAAKGVYKSSGKVREGLVYRSMDQSVSFKVINNDYLLGKKK
eukprot:CAMPEP_0113638920 /NCGR_PEP_ID=MMETSP0017_2-20120614/20405_1 /TAXON_ID=2856 /ORGANISM="Cylindrotheca closterium" /LENGTH=380 /DNA_ID=CAMNT_0000550083 /DNA_START=79 /DNA_END=1221 /DNA_ORIENTATION=+ /assembly_acc=CAM_ASM_000147